MKDVLADYLKTGPTQKELDDAKRELAGSFPLSTASNADIVGQLGAMGFYNLPLSYLDDFMKQSQALTVEQVQGCPEQTPEHRQNGHRHRWPDRCAKAITGPHLINLPSNRSGFRSINGNSSRPKKPVAKRA